MQLYLADGSFIITDEGIDCSIPLEGSENNPRAWYVDAPIIEPVRTAEWTGSVAEGGSVNFRNITFNPHGHGTHTECLGHITKEVHSVNGCISDQFLTAILISVDPEDVLNEDGLTDKVINESHFESLRGKSAEALLIRTLPNTGSKKSFNYSDQNAAYLDLSVMKILDELGIKHLLLDLPSVDREKDNGALAFHHAFWEVPENPRFDRTITEMIYVPSVLTDGDYILNLQTAPFVNDATPSRPIIFELHRNAESD